MAGSAFDTFDLSMTDTLIVEVPMELGLEFMAVVGPEFPDGERPL